MLNFSTTSQEAHTNGIKCFIYGRAGIGKTMLSATAPRPIIISAERGLLSLSTANITKVFGAGRADISYDIPVMTIEDMNDLLQALEFCKVETNIQNFDTIILDSISEIAEIVLQNEKVLVKDARKAYLELADKVIAVIRGFRDLNKNVVFICKMGSNKDEISGVTMYGPMLPGAKLPQAVPYLFDELYRLDMLVDAQTKQSHRYLQTAAEIQYDAKNRGGGLEAKETAHLGYIFSKILGATN